MIDQIAHGKRIVRGVPDNEKGKSFYDKVYGQDNPQTTPYGWIQWKGTDVCMDIHCVCGDDGHFDGEFFYRYECPKCHRKFAVGQNVKLIEMTPELLEEEQNENWGAHEYLTYDPRSCI